MLYTIAAPAASFELSLLESQPEMAVNSVERGTQPQRQGSGAGFMLLAVLLMVSFGVLSLGAVKLAEKSVPSQGQPTEAISIR